MDNTATLTKAASIGDNPEDIVQDSGDEERASKLRSKVWTKVAWFSRRARNSDLAIKHINPGSLHHGYEHRNLTEPTGQFNNSCSSDDSLDSLDDDWLVESDRTSVCLQSKSSLDIQLKGCVSRARAIFAGKHPLSDNTSTFVNLCTEDDHSNHTKDSENCDSDLQATIEDFSEACKEFLNGASLDCAVENSVDTSAYHSEDDTDGVPNHPTCDNQFSVSVQFDSTVCEAEHTACSDAGALPSVVETQLTVDSSSNLSNATTTKEKGCGPSQKVAAMWSDHSSLALRRVVTPPNSAPLLRHHFLVPLRSCSPSISSLKSLSHCNSVDAASLPGKLNDVGRTCLVQRAMSVPQSTCNNCSPILGMKNDMFHCLYGERSSECSLNVTNHNQLHCNSPDIRQGNQDMIRKLHDSTGEDRSSSPFCKQYKRGYGRKVSDPLSLVPELTVEKMFLEECDAEGRLLQSKEEHGSSNSLQSVVSSNLQRSVGLLGQQNQHGSLWSLRSHCSSVLSRSGSHCCDRVLSNYSKGVTGNVFKERMEKVLFWFNEFNDQQRNSMFTKLLGHCTCAQMHLLSVYMEPILHLSCPHNCEDFLSWLPPGLAFQILSYLDPVSLCRCSQVCYSWFNMANDPKLWMNLCRVDKWQMSPASRLKQLKVYTLSDGRVQWKSVFAECFRLFSNWMKGRCTVRTFAGHTQGILCIQFDDTRIVSGSSDKTIKVWNIRTNTPWAALTLAGHSGPVRCLHLYGNRLVSGSTDRTIKVWDLATDKVDWVGAACRATMVGHSHTVRCLQSDGEKVISGSYDHTLKVWDVKCGQCKVTLRGHTDAVLCLQFVGGTLVSGSSDQTIKVWSLPQGQCRTTLHGHQAAVTCVQFDQSRIISGSLDRFIKIWSINSGQCIRNLDWIKAEGHTGVVRQLQVDRWKMVSAADDRTLKVWGLDSGKRLVTLQSHSDGVTCLQFNDTTIVSGSYDKTVKLWDFSAC